MLRRHHGLAAAIAVSLCGSLHAANIVVTDAGDAGSGSTCTLRQAITSINGATTVGSCAVTGVLDGNYAIEFTPSLAGATITLGGTELAVTKAMTIDGTGQVIDANNRSRVMSLKSATLSIDGLTLTRGNAGGPIGGGGGIYVVSSTLTMRNSTITGNFAGLYGGGGLAVKQSVVTLNGSVVSNNATDGLGGGIDALSESIVTLTNSTLSGNSTQRYGGGAHVSFSTLAVADSLVSGNTAPAFGGGVDATNGYLTVSNSAFVQNTAGQRGGGIASYDTHITVDRSSIDHNYSTHIGGGIYAFGYLPSMSVVTLTASTVSNNQAGELGGGVATGQTTFAFVNTTVSGNSAVSGGGGLLAGYRAVVRLNNSTIAGNSADYGGGVAAKVNGGVSCTNTILSANTATSSGADLSMQTIAPVTADHCLLGSALSPSFAGNANLFTDSPMLGPLQNNSGPTQTMAALPGSPAIDAGSNNLAVDAQGAALGYDQTGFTRVFGATVDIGAYEFRSDLIFADGFD